MPEWVELLSLETVLPPSSNNNARFVAGRMYTPTKVTEYRRTLKSSLPDDSLNLNSEAPIKVHIDIHPKTRRSIDLDNRIKCLLDALQKAKVFIDDKQVVEIVGRKHKFDPNRKDVCAIKVFEKIECSP